MTQPRALILHAPGTNRDGDLAHALSLAGACPEIQPLSQLASSKANWKDYHLLALPGGFSYGDALGAGRLWALDLQTWLYDLIHEFSRNHKPVIGICNGFQALVKTGVLPGSRQIEPVRQATLTFNLSGHFECRWVALLPNSLNPSPWLKDLPVLECPVAHGEGRFLMARGIHLPPEQVALRYARPDGSPANGEYPANPNGSPGDIAGVTNPDGNILGLMPHPEDHVHPHQHPLWTRRGPTNSCLALFKNGLAIT